MELVLAGNVSCSDYPGQNILSKDKSCMHGCKVIRFNFCLNTSTFSVMCFDESPFTCQCEKENRKA